MSRALDDQTKRDIAFDEKELNTVLMVECRKILIRIGRYYFTAIKIVEHFCKTYPEIDKTLNKYYIRIFKDIEELVESIHSYLEKRMSKGLLPSDYVHAKIFTETFYRPFENFHTAEFDLTKDGITTLPSGRLDWPEVRKRMNNFIGHINSIFTFNKKLFKDDETETLLRSVNSYLTEKSESGLDLDTFSKPDWPEYFRFINKNSFMVGNNKELEFSKKVNNKRKEIFIQLTKGKGNWVRVKDVSKRVGETESYIKSTIRQLRQTIINQGLHNYIAIESRGRHDKFGAAYRITSPK